MTINNFDYLEEGCWYQLVNGNIGKCTLNSDGEFVINGQVYTELGNVHPIFKQFTANLKIKPPEILPMEKVRYRIIRWAAIVRDNNNGEFRTDGGLYCTIEEAYAKFEESKYSKLIKFQELVIEGEVECG